MPVKTYTPDELAALGTPSHLLTEHLKTYPGLPFDSEDAADMDKMRKVRIAHLDTRRTHYPIPGPIPEIVSETDVFIDFPPSKCQIQVRVYSSVHTSEKAKGSGVPVIMLMHEGGFMLGDISDEQMNSRLFASSFDCVVLNIEYLLAPEHPYPASVQSCYHILETLCSSPKTFHPLANPSLGIVLGGSSAGGNLTAILSHQARQNKLKPPVTGQWLGVPFIAPTSMIPDKYKSVAHSHTLRVDPILDPGENEATLEGLLAGIGVKEYDDPQLTPFASVLYPPDTKNNGPVLAPLAKAFIQAAGLDPLRDQGIIYAKALEEDWRSEVKIHVYGGYGHMFWTNFPLLEVSKQFWKDTVKGFEWMLGQEAKREW